MKVSNSSTCFDDVLKLDNGSCREPILARREYNFVFKDLLFTTHPSASKFIKNVKYASLRNVTENTSDEVS